MVEKGISRLGRPTADVMSAIENQGNIEVSKLEKACLYGQPQPLSTHGWILGTVTGMVHCIHGYG